MTNYIMIVCIALLTGCGMKQQLVKKENIEQQQEEIIARCSDMPDVPFQVQLKNIVVLPEDHNDMQLFYTTTLSQQDFVTFYEQQMERLGWQLSAESKIQDCCLYYTKPQRFCLIVIVGNSFSMYIGTKKGA
ncbi:hypothetical protein KBC04_01440 [Candidatus Babeliales bacterium]|nr:hypothetical protein [Candidatus Babeliales bacterium]MBP9843616.1 hypothetical protein [Candidatus Babeliales bacterium]